METVQPLKKLTGNLGSYLIIVNYLRKYLNNSYIVYIFDTPRWIHVPYPWGTLDSPFTLIDWSVLSLFVGVYSITSR